MHILHLNQRNQRNQILFQYLRDKKKKKEGGSEKGGVKIHPFHLPWIRVCLVHQRLKLSVLDMLCQLSGHARGVVEFSFSKWLKLIQFDFILLHSLITKTT